MNVGAICVGSYRTYIFIPFQTMGTGVTYTTNKTERPTFACLLRKNVVRILRYILKEVLVLVFCSVGRFCSDEFSLE